MVMMNNWNSISEIKKFLEVPPSTSISDVRDILKQRLLDLHPDRTSGNFISADHEEKFHKVGSALDFIRHINSTELVRNESPSLEARSEEHTSELQSLMRISYAVFCLNKKKDNHKSLYAAYNELYSWEIDSEYYVCDG